MTLITHATGPNHTRCPVAIFPDFEHMASYLASKPVIGNDGYDPDITRKALATGDPVLAERAERMLATLEQPDAVYADNVPAWGRSVSGALPDVPAYLAGSPLNMRRRVPSYGLAPLTIVVETFMSGGVSDADRDRRSVAILALIRKLAMTGHAVDLYLAHTSMREAATCLIRIENRPLDLVRAVWGFAASFERKGFKMASAQVLYNLRGYKSLQPPFGIATFPNDPVAQTAYYAPILSPDNALLAIPSYHGSDSFFGTDASTRQWLEKNYQKATDLARQQLAA
jgi:hypothetical protein